MISYYPLFIQNTYECREKVCGRCYVKVGRYKMHIFEMSSLALCWKKENSPRFRLSL